MLGLNTYQWPEEVPFSFTKHPEILERYWQTCIDTLKDKEVVWSVGYRGKFDRPFWVDEPEIATPQARGEVISRAIAKQVEIIRRAQPDAAIIANMWEEGANLYRQGVITLPPGVAPVWPDDGTGLMRENGLAHILGVTGIRDAAARSSIHGGAAAIPRRRRPDVASDGDGPERARCGLSWAWGRGRYGLGVSTGAF